MKATAVAPANIAFIKYWGKADPTTKIPSNNSVSMNLSEMTTTTTVEFSDRLDQDSVRFLGEDVVTDREIARVISALDAIRSAANTKKKARVVTKNSFPKATGIASSASGFASLAKASFAALSHPVEEKNLSRFCRTLSGTACRSIPDGITEWEKGADADTSFAHSLYPPEYWDICDVVAIVSKTMKKVRSSDGHALAHTSPFYNDRIKGIDAKVSALKKAMEKKDFSAFGTIIEEEALNMHAICLTSRPGLLYWEPQTAAVMKLVLFLREHHEIESYFTIDAGPSVHVICEGKNAAKVAEGLKAVPGVMQVVVNRPSKGARLSSEHLF